MRKILKHTLLVAVLVLCLFGISMVAASATEFTGATAQTSAHVASITSGGTTYYYETFTAARADARANSPAEIVVLQSTSGETDAGVYSDFEVTVKGADATVALTMPAKTFAVGASKITFENIILNMTGDAIYYPNNCEASVTFTNVKMNLNGNYNMEVSESAGGATLSITMTNCEINHSAPSESAYFFYAPKTTLTYNIAGLKTNAAIVKGDPAIDWTIADIEMTTNYPVLIGTGNGYTIIAEGYGNDATAKANGCNYRVGEVTTGKKGEVYFENDAEALQAAAAGVKVYDISGAAPQEILKACEHDFSAATCVAKAKCSKCGVETGELLAHNYSEATCTAKATCSGCGDQQGELARHKYTAATCTEKSKCSVCGEERGELAKHTDADKNNKCDKCQADLTLATTTPADDAEEKGCGGTVTVAGLALVAALGSCAIFVEKKRK